MSGTVRKVQCSSLPRPRGQGLIILGASTHFLASEPESKASSLCPTSFSRVISVHVVTADGNKIK